MTMRVDMSDVDASFDPIPAGWYQARVVEGEVKTSGEGAKHPGAEYIAWKLQVSDGEHEGRPLYVNTSIGHGSCGCGNWTEKAYISLKLFMKATGLFADEQLDSPDFGFEIDDILGNEMAVLVGITTYEGEERNSVRRQKALTDAADQLSASAGSTSLLP